MNIEELKNKHLEAIILNTEISGNEYGTVIEGKEDAAKEATNITLSFCIEQLQEMYILMKRVQPPFHIKQREAFTNKIQELEKLIEKW